MGPLAYSPSRGPIKTIKGSWFVVVVDGLSVLTAQQTVATCSTHQYHCSWQPSRPDCRIERTVSMPVDVNPNLPPSCSGCTTLEHLPDVLLERIFTLACAQQLVALDRFKVARGFPPLLLLSKRVDKIVQQVPIKHVHVLIDTCRGHQSCKTLFATNVLLSIRSPVQFLAFTGGTALSSDWSPVLSYVKSCAYPNQVLKLRVRHRNACNSIDPAPVSGVLVPERPIDAMRRIISKTSFLMYMTG